MTKYQPLLKPRITFGMPRNNRDASTSTMAGRLLNGISNSRNFSAPKL